MVLPVADGPTALIAEFTDNRTIRGEVEIWRSSLVDERLALRLDPPVGISHDVADALRRCDLIVLAPGSFYTSIVPLVLVEGMVDSLLSATAPTCMVMNLTNKNGHTDNFTCSDYLSELRRYAGDEIVSIIVQNSSALAGRSPADDISGAQRPELGEIPCGVAVVAADLVDRSVSESTSPATGESSMSRNDGFLARTSVKHDEAATAALVRSLATNTYRAESVSGPS